MAIGFFLALGAGCSGAPSDDGGVSSAGGAAGTTTSPVADAGDALFGINVDPRNEAAYPTADELHALGATRVRIEIKVDDAGLDAAYRIYDDALTR